jgi:hypothetical protein
MLLHTEHVPIFSNWLCSEKGASKLERLTVLRCVNRSWREELGRAVAQGRLWADLDSFVGGRWGSRRLLRWEPAGEREMVLHAVDVVLCVHRQRDRLFVAVEVRWLDRTVFDEAYLWKLVAGRPGLRRVGIVLDTLSLKRSVDDLCEEDVGHCTGDSQCKNPCCRVIREQWPRSRAGVLLWTVVEAGIFSVSAGPFSKEVVQFDWPAYLRSHDWQEDVDTIHVLACMWRDMIGRVTFGHLFRAYLVHSIVPFVGVAGEGELSGQMRKRLQQEACLIPFEAVPLEAAAEDRYHRSLITNGVKGVGFPWASAAMRVCVLRRELAARLEAESEEKTGNRHDFLRTLGFPLHACAPPTRVDYVERGQGGFVSKFSFEGGVMAHRSWRDRVEAELLAKGPRLRRVTGLQVFESVGVP